MVGQIDGLWTAEFGSLSGWTSGGIVVLDKGRLFGGGDHYYCLGRYTTHGRVFAGDARCSHFHGPVFTVFGDTLSDFHLGFRGRWLDDLIDGEMHRTESPGTTLPFRLMWRAGLP